MSAKQLPGHACMGVYYVHELRDSTELLLPHVVHGLLAWAQVGDLQYIAVPSTLLEEVC